MENSKVLHDDPGLIPHRIQPENLESPINIINSWITPNDLFYIRNHLSYPSFSLDSWVLTFKDKSKNKRFGYAELLNMPQISKTVTIECSGNKRGLMEPPVSGDQWNLGAIGNAKFTGVPLSYLLDQVGLDSNIEELVFKGLDSGTRPDLPGTFNFERSLPNDKTLLSECLLALSMNDEPLPFKHGFPLRLIVPGWYGMAHVKWLSEISAIDSQFKGPFQVVDYVYLQNEDDYSNAIPVAEIKVNSIISWPSKGEQLKPDAYTIKGLAWAGKATILYVQISTDNGFTWNNARLTSPEHGPYTWTFWEYSWEAITPGHYFIIARAVDSNGNKQPRVAAWNAKGYGNNSTHRIQVTIPSAPKLPN